MRRPREGAKPALALASLVKAHFVLAETDAVMVNELTCPTPGCPPLETCILFWKGGPERYRLRFFKPMAEVEPEDLPPKWLLPGLLDEAEGCC